MTPHLKAETRYMELTPERKPLASISSSTDQRVPPCQRFGRFLALVVLLGVPAFASAADEAPQVADKPIAVEMGAHHTLWQTPSGGSYTEIASGLNYWTGEGWARAQETIAIVNGYGVATNGAHRAVFSPSITDQPAVDYVDPSGNRLQSNVRGLAYYDYASGKLVMICECKQSTGIVDSNTVVYADCFTDGIKGNIKYTYKKGSFEQEIVLLAQLPPAAAFSLNENSTRLQAWTEMLEPPAPTVKKTTYIYQETDPAIRQALVEPDFKDESLEWNQTLIPRGKAFAIDSDAIRQAEIDVEREVPVGKEWVAAADPDTKLIRRFLVESVELATVKPLLDTLPMATIGTPTDKNSRLANAKQRTGLPRAQFLAALPKSVRDLGGAFAAKTRDRAGLQTRGTRQIELAKATDRNRKAKGVSLDYSTILTATNVTLKSGQTYYCSSAITLAGTNILEACVIKYAKNTGKITIAGSGATLVCVCTNWRNAILTSEGDYSVGEVVGVDPPPADTSPCADTALYFDYVSSGVVAALRNLNIRYAHYGVYFDHGTNHVLSHSQLVGCQSAIGLSTDGVILRNVLAYNSSNVVNGNMATVRAENCTFDTGTYLVAGFYTPTLLFTNCLISGLSTNYTNYSGANSSNVTSSAYQTVGAATHYLANNSANRNAGTTNINASLLADLRKLTTYPPILISNPITNDTILSAQAQRDTDDIDQGYHYSPLDYVLNTSITNSTLSLTSSVAVAVYGTTGLKMQTSSKLNSLGDPVNLNHLVRYELVQEQSNNNWTNRPKTALFADDLVSGTMPEARLRFTELSVSANGGAQFSTGTKMGVLAATDCRFLNGGLTWNVNGTNTRALTLTNSLFERTTNILGTSADAFTFHARNNLFWNSGLKLSPTNSNSWTWYDNVFDSDIVTTNSNTFTNDYNGYLSVSEFASHGTHDVVTNLTWQGGVLGSYYQATNSPFLNTGSRNATNAGLYHYCVTTNNVKETNTVVDMGLHYIAVDLSTGLPYDFDGDGIPDWLEDFNGNGSVDSGETNWQDAGDSGLRVLITRPKNNSVIP